MTAQSVGGISRTYSYDANNRLLSSSDGKSYTYDANGNTLTERTNGTVRILSIVFRKFSIILNRLNHNTPVKPLARHRCLHEACP
jgi:YD repeat-containing protein